MGTPRSEKVFGQVVLELKCHFACRPVIHGRLVEKGRYMHGVAKGSLVDALIELDDHFSSTESHSAGRWNGIHHNRRVAIHRTTLGRTLGGACGQQKRNGDQDE